MVYPIGKRIIPSIVKKLWVREVNGRENLPRGGSFIIATNHASYMDHFVMSLIVQYLDRKIHVLAKKEYFDNIFMKVWHSYVGAIPIDRQSGGKGALKLAVKALKEGKIIGIYPEGTRSLNGKLQKAKTGIARLALAAKVPVVPVGLIGTFEVLPKGKYIPKFKKAIMNIGQSMHFEKYRNKKINKKMLREITSRIMKEIAKLSNQKYNFK